MRMVLKMHARRFAHSGDNTGLSSGLTVLAQLLYRRRCRWSSALFLPALEFPSLLRIHDNCRMTYTACLYACCSCSNCCLEASSKSGIPARGVPAHSMKGMQHRLCNLAALPPSCRPEKPPEVAMRCADRRSYRCLCGRSGHPHETATCVCRL